MAPALVVSLSDEDSQPVIYYVGRRWQNAAVAAGGFGQPADGVASASQGV